MYQTLASLTSIKDINVTVKGLYWENADRDEFPEDLNVKGKLVRWTSVKGATVKIEWSDGWDTEHMSILLLPKNHFTLVSMPTGGPVKRKGGAHPAAAPGTVAVIGVQPEKEAVKVPYKIGVQEYEQVWEVETESISVDWRTKEREMPHLKIDPGTVTDMTSMYINATCVMPIVEKQVYFMNQRLSGVVTVQDKTNRYTTAGELLRVRGYMGALANHPHLTREEAFRTAPLPHDIFDPPNLGKYGLSKNRLSKLLSLMWKYWEVDESDLNKNYQWRYIDHFEKDFNQYRLTKFAMGWLITADELMSWYETEKEGNPTISIEPYISNPALIPKLDFVPRKPKPLGKEIKVAADGESKMFMRLEYQRGKEDHKKQPYFDDYGHTIAQSVRLTEPWHGTDKVYIADAWFGGVTTCEVLRSHGSFSFSFSSRSRARARARASHSCLHI